MGLGNGSYEGSPHQVGRGWGREEQENSILLPPTENVLMGEKLGFSSTFSSFLDPHMSKPRCPREAKFSSIPP